MCVKMSISFLISYGVLSGCFSQKSITDFTVSAKEVYDKIFDLCRMDNYCSIYGCSQSLDKIKSAFNGEQKARFEDNINRENATLGCSGYGPEDYLTLAESAKSLSFSGYVIVICDDKEKANIKVNSRAITITPADFIFLLNECLSLLDKVQKLFPSRLTLMDFLIGALFRKDAYESLKNNIDKIVD